MINNNNNRRFVFFEDVVRLTGLSASTIQRRIREGKIKASQPGGPRSRLLFDATTLGLDTSESEDNSSEQQQVPKGENNHRPGPKLDWIDQQNFE